MEPFIQAFFSVDTDGDETIYIKDLENYVKRNNMDPKMVDRWKELFDKEGTGKITLQKFCHVLGLEITKVREQRHGGLRKEIHVIKATMPLNNQVPVSEAAYQMISSGRLNEQDLCEQLRQYLNKTYGNHWHVVITDSSTWASFSEIPGTSFFFECKGRKYLLWRTPE
ncbi:unnamed protein product [Calicophoron daubneyi]|uniref:EF-hand domain-containing protein n=1 Tax=Calicophoron daubneyi TaxID=300641 RepID=A0AAV2T415_CALDB